MGHHKRKGNKGPYCLREHRWFHLHQRRAWYERADLVAAKVYVLRVLGRHLHTSWMCVVAPNSNLRKNDQQDSLFQSQLIFSITTVFNDALHAGRASNARFRHISQSQRRSFGHILTVCKWLSYSWGHGIRVLIDNNIPQHSTRGLVNARESLFDDGCEESMCSATTASACIFSLCGLCGCCC